MPKVNLENEIAKAIMLAFVSPNVSDSDLEAANLVDTTDDMASGLNNISISLDGCSTQIERIADSIHRLADVMNNTDPYRNERLENIEASLSNICDAIERK